MNKVFLIGNLSKDPETSETSSGTAYCRFTIAVNRPFTDADGNRQADFFNCIAWNNLALNCGKFLAKGRKVAVIGSLQNRAYETQNGERRTVTDVIAKNVEFLTPRDNEEKPAKPTRPQQQYMDGFEPPKKKMPTLEPVNDDDLPF